MAAPLQPARPTSRTTAVMWRRHLERNGVLARYTRRAGVLPGYEAPLVYIEVNLGVGQGSNVDRRTGLVGRADGSGYRAGPTSTAERGQIGVACLAIGEGFSAAGNPQGVGAGLEEVPGWGGIVSLSEGDRFEVPGVMVGKGDRESVVLIVQEVIAAGQAAGFAAKAVVVLA